MRRATNGIVTKWQAVTIAGFTGVFYLLILTVLDHTDDDKPWGEAARGNVFGALFLTVWMSLSFYYWPRWMANRSKTKG